MKRIEEKIEEIINSLTTEFNDTPFTKRTVTITKKELKQQLQELVKEDEAYIKYLEDQIQIVKDAMSLKKSIDEFGRD